MCQITFISVCLSVCVSVCLSVCQLHIFELLSMIHFAMQGTMYCPTTIVFAFNYPNLAFNYSIQAINYPNWAFNYPIHALNYPLLTAVQYYEKLNNVRNVRLGSCSCISSFISCLDAIHVICN